MVMPNSAVEMIATVGGGTEGGRRPTVVAPPTAAIISTAEFGITTRHSPTHPEPKLHRVLCLIVIGTEGDAEAQATFKKTSPIWSATRSMAPLPARP